MRRIPAESAPARRGASKPTAELALAAFLALAAAFSLASGPASAQVVRGTLVGLPDGEPLPRGHVALMDSAGTPVDSTRAGTDGTFTLAAPEAGPYLLYFSHPDYAAVPSELLDLTTGDTLTYRFEVPLVGGAALRRISETFDLETRLQGDIVELCGERPRPWEAGILVGTVRRRADRQPLAGAVVRVTAPGQAEAEPFRKATVSSANGVYVICNVPEGPATLRTDLAGYRTDEGPVEAHAGTIGWYDVFLRKR